MTNHEGSHSSQNTEVKEAARVISTIILQAIKHN